uniref:DUF659 domain-containing protein n=1 Tax=Cajanus cajan TaxID=3821 RepID=A0A151SB38_CAJCA|nr:hypothetical protein KK1_026110 [Cajanus cajan]
MFEEKRPKFYWAPCATHCIDLMLQDIGKLPNIKKIIQQVISLVDFIYSHSSTLSLLRFYTNKSELVSVDGEKKPVVGYVYEGQGKGSYYEVF